MFVLRILCLFDKVFHLPLDIYDNGMPGADWFLHMSSSTSAMMMVNSDDRGARSSGTIATLVYNTSFL